MGRQNEYLRNKIENINGRKISDTKLKNFSCMFYLYLEIVQKEKAPIKGLLFYILVCAVKAGEKSV